MSNQPLSDSTQLAVDCAKYLQLLLFATDMGQYSAELSTGAIFQTIDLTESRQTEVRRTLVNAGLMHVEWIPVDEAGEYAKPVFALGDGG